MIHLQPIEDRIEIAKKKASDKTRFKLKDKFAEWREKPELYAKERLNITLTGEQVQILYSVKNNRRTAVKAHHALGKSFVAAILALWWIDCWDSHICYITAPTWSQALALTFKQAKRLAIINNLDFDILDSGIIRDKDNFKATERFIKAINAERSEGIQGEHTSPILIIGDEAIGIPTYIFEGMEGLMTDPRCRWCLIFNPTDEATKAGELCESPNVETFSFSALIHPNIEAELRGKPRPFDGAISLQWLFEMLRDEADETDNKIEDSFEFYSLDVIEQALHGTPTGANSPKCYYKPSGYFQGRVLGEFPTEASTKVIPKGWLKSLPVLDINPSHSVQIGCDTARFGDDRSTAFSRIGAVCLFARVMRKFDGKSVAMGVVDLINETCRYLKEHYGVEVNPKKIPINIDITGGLGTEPLGFLLDWGYNATGINSSESPNDEVLFINKRSELWFVVRDRIKYKNVDYSRLPPDIKKALVKELTMPTYEVRGGKKVVEPKEKMKNRLKVSPDLADGFNLAFYETTPFTVDDRIKNLFGGFKI
jgi:phage terminase large subunit